MLNIIVQWNPNIKWKDTVRFWDNTFDIKEERWLNINRPYAIHFSITGTKNYITSLHAQGFSLYQGFTVQLQ